MANRTNNQAASSVIPPTQPNFVSVSTPNASTGGARVQHPQHTRVCKLVSATNQELATFTYTMRGPSANAIAQDLKIVEARSGGVLKFLVAAE